MHRASKSAAGDAGSMPRNGTAHAVRPHSACNARRAIQRRLGGVDIVDDRRQDRRRRATPASTGRVGNHGAQRGLPLRACDSPAWRMGAGWARMQRECGLHADGVGAQALCRYPASRWMHREAVRHAPRMRSASVNRRCACTVHRTARTVPAPATHPPRELPRRCDGRPALQRLRRVRGEKEREFRGGGRGTDRGNGRAHVPIGERNRSSERQPARRKPAEGRWTAQHGSTSCATRRARRTAGRRG